jgi:HNH endonuclease
MQITLANGMVALIDDKNADLICKHRWQAYRGRSSWYAYAWHNGRNIYMHRLIAGAKWGEHVDHKDHNGLNNLENNLRVCTNMQNQQNGRKQNRVTSSKYKGVSLARRKWRAIIQVDRKRIHLGYFDNQEDAAGAYNAAAVEYFGEYASLNNLDGDSLSRPPVGDYPQEG